MPNLVAISQATAKINRGGGIHPPQALSVSNHPGQIGLRPSGWCNLHKAGCIIQVAGHVLWPRAAWLYQESVTHKKANISVSGASKIVGM